MSHPKGEGTPRTGPAGPIPSSPLRSRVSTAAVRRNAFWRGQESLRGRAHHDPADRTRGDRAAIEVLMTTIGIVVALLVGYLVGSRRRTIIRGVHDERFFVAMKRGGPPDAIYCSCCKACGGEPCRISMWEQL